MKYSEPNSIINLMPQAQGMDPMATMMAMMNNGGMGGNNGWLMMLFVLILCTNGGLLGNRNQADAATATAQCNEALTILGAIGGVKDQVLATGSAVEQVVALNADRIIANNNAQTANMLTSQGEIKSSLSTIRGEMSTGYAALSTQICNGLSGVNKSICDVEKEVLASTNALDKSIYTSTVETAKTIQCAQNQNNQSFNALNASVVNGQNILSRQVSDGFCEQTSQNKDLACGINNLARQQASDTAAILKDNACQTNELKAYIDIKEKDAVIARQQELINELRAKDRHREESNRNFEINNNQNIVNLLQNISNRLINVPIGGGTSA